MKMSKHILVGWIITITMIISVLFCNKSMAAEAICFENQFITTDVHLWAIPNQGKGSYKERHIKPGDESCYIVDNDKRILILFEAINYRQENRWIYIGTFTAGKYKIYVNQKGYLKVD